jgi:hypothetical protein
MKGRVKAAIGQIFIGIRQEQKYLERILWASSAIPSVQSNSAPSDRNL